MNKCTLVSCLLVVQLLFAAAPGAKPSSPPPANPPAPESPAPQPPANPAPPEVAPAAPVPASDVIIKQNFGDVSIERDEVVKRVEMMAGHLNVAGTILETATVRAGDVDISGKVLDGVESGAGNVRVSGRVGSGGISLKVGNVEVSGEVDGPVHIGIGELKIVGDGVVNGDVQIGMGGIPEGREHIKGSVRVGEHRFERGRHGRGPGGGEVAFLGLMTLLGLAAFIFILAVLFPGSVQKGVSMMHRENVALNLLWGLLAILLFLPIFVMFLVTIVGIPIALMMIPLYFVAWLFGIIMLADYVGDWVITSLIKGKSNFLIATILGIIVLDISVMIPVFGPVLMLIYTFIAFGVSFRMLFGYVQARRGKPPLPPVAPPPPPPVPATPAA